MAIQTVVKRYELKYLITREQRRELLEVMAPHMKLDQYGHSVICNLYYDTDNFLLVRRSEERPVYKEKLRVRSYGSKAEPDGPVFVELKKKFQSVVYKRRLGLPERDAMAWLAGGNFPGTPSQIAGEIQYFRDYYETPRPRVFLSYEREAFYDVNGSDFRMTFDENIVARTDRLSLCQPVGGTPLLASDCVLLEVKTSGAIPLWLSAFLTQRRIFKTSLSKYGTAYNTMICKEGELLYVS